MCRLLLCLAFAVFASAVAADTTCTTWNDQLDSRFLSSIRSALQENDSENKVFGSYDLDLMVVGASWKGLTVGNFSSIRQSPSTDAQLCVNGNVNTLKADLTLETLQTSFSTLEITTPIADYSSAALVVNLKGEVLSLELTATTDASTQKCTLALTRMEFSDWGSLTVDFGTGIVNWILSKIFNSFLSSITMTALVDLGFGDQINAFIETNVAPIVAQYSDLYCALITQ